LDIQNRANTQYLKYSSRCEPVMLWLHEQHVPLYDAWWVSLLLPLQTGSNNLHERKDVRQSHEEFLAEAEQPYFRWETAFTKVREIMKRFGKMHHCVW
jgi:hypothetical protein